jgi:hypothetical protein
VNKKDPIFDQLAALGLGRQEAVIYLELLKQPATHAHLSAATGINRTTLYRLVAKLQKRGIIAPRVDDRGKVLTVADASALEVEVVNQETRAKRRRSAFEQLIPTLEMLQKGFAADFAVQTYEGVEGFKRMLWHELKTQGDCLCLGTGRLEDLVQSRSWAEKHRRLSTEAGYRVREIANSGQITDPQSAVEGFYETYELRIVPRSTIAVNYMVAVYNDTVAVYHVNGSQRRGLEIISKHFAETMRSMLELCWAAAHPPAKQQTPSL